MDDGRERRCPTCGALVSVEAEWCGQCYSALEGPSPPTSAAALIHGEDRPREATPTEVRAAPVEARVGEPAWPCAVCGHRNPIELDRCEVCGASFAQLLREPADRVEVEPRTAVLWSLAFPGLGHRLCRRGFEGLARAVLFLWTGGTVALLLLSRSGSSSFGSAGALLLLFVVSALFVYGSSAVDAYRIAAGEEPLVSSRALLWGSAGLVLLSVLLATIATMSSLRLQ